MSGGKVERIEREVLDTVLFWAEVRESMPDCLIDLPSIMAEKLRACNSQYQRMLWQHKSTSG